jgi:hypothetical protein
MFVRLSFASKVGLPPAYLNAHKAPEIKMQIQHIGADAERRCERIHAAEMYKQMLFPINVELLIIRLHKALNMGECPVWEQLDHEWDSVKEATMHQPAGDKSREEVDNKQAARIGELELLLT